MKRILVVEDDRHMRENIIELLSLNDYYVVVANNGREALSKINSEKIDLVLSDIMMPGINGIELYKKIKNDSSLSDLPFIFLTAKSDLDSQRFGMNLGADDYLTKPYKAKDLLNAVEIRLKKYDEQKEKFRLLENNISKYVPHELRTPLGIILGFSNLICESRDELSKDEIIEMVLRINRSAQRLHQRIEKIILLTEVDIDLNDNENSRMSSNSMIICNKILIENIVLPLIQYYDRPGDVTVQVEETALNINEFYFKRLITELVDNAFKFSDSGSKVLIEGQKVGDKYEIKITDHGFGISEEEIKNLAAFKQYKRELIQQEGNGLGLQIVEKILSLFNTGYKITSNNSDNTCVSFCLNQHGK